MRITWLSHSGFLVEGESAILLFDLFEDPADRVAAFLRKRRADPGSLRPFFLFVSHVHADHCSPRVLEFAREPGAFLVLEDEAAERLLGRGDAAGDARRGVVRLGPGATVRLGGAGRPVAASAPAVLEVATFGSTDRGVSFRVRLDGRTLFHAGDLNDWYWEEESTAAELVADEAAFDRIVEEIRVAEQAAGDAPLDVAFLPLDPRLGAHATRGPLRFVRRLPTTLVVPMHLPVGTALPAELARTVGTLARVVALEGAGAFFTLEPVGPGSAPNEEGEP
jgi:L-ascorbate metabolism protein UlaG (beta-lactamase superfamily)